MREWLKKLRSKKGMTQRGLAACVGVSQNFYSSIETGERRPSPEVAQKLADVLDFDKHGRHWSDLLIKE